MPGFGECPFGSFAFGESCIDVSIEEVNQKHRYIRSLMRNLKYDLNNDNSALKVLVEAFDAQASKIGGALNR